jgi:prepilin-type N-terminal cleavage/methylation domain-containing protein
MQTANTKILQKHATKGFGGFTLVELIVVITILAILGTIGFIQLGGFQSNTRDSIRTFDLTNLSKGLDVFQIKSGRYPVPTGTLSYTG